MNKLWIALGLIILMGACGKEREVIEDEIIEVNIDEIDIILNNPVVVQGEAIRFDITGRADVLTFFSGELGHEYYENSLGGAEYKGKVDYLEYIYEEEGEYEAVFLLADNSGRERMIGPFQITVNADLEAVTVVPDRSTVVAGEKVRFDITGKAHSFTFYSGEPDHDYDTSIGGIGHEGTPEFYEYEYNTEGEYDAYFLLKNRSGDELAVGPFKITVLSANPALVAGTLHGTILNPDFAFDLAGMTSYAPGNSNNPGTAHAPGVPEKIDVVLMWLGNEPSFALPTGVTNTSSSGVFTLEPKNDGVLFRLESPTAEEIARFEALETREDLIAIFDLEYAALPSRPGYVKSIYEVGGENTTGQSNHGPITGGPWPGGTTARIRGANVGDIFYFKSLDRDLYVAFRVASMVKASGGAIELEVKSILVD